MDEVSNQRQQNDLTGEKFLRVDSVRTDTQANRQTKI